MKGRARVGCTIGAGIPMAARQGLRGRAVCECHCNCNQWPGDNHQGDS